MGRRQSPALRVVRAAMLTGLDMRAMLCRTHLDMVIH